MLKKGQTIIYFDNGKILMEISSESESQLDLTTQRYIRLAQPYEPKDARLVLPVPNAEGKQSKYFECGKIVEKKIETDSLVFITNMGEFRIRYRHIDLEALLKEVSNAKGSPISKTAMFGKTIPDFPWKE
jgi:hypothetical protein